MYGASVARVKLEEIASSAVSASSSLAAKREAEGERGIWDLRSA